MEVKIVIFLCMKKKVKLIIINIQLNTKYSDKIAIKYSGIYRHILF